MKPGLEINGVSVELGGRIVLDDVSLSAAAGEFLGLIGPNGAGKTTVLRAAMGLVPLRAGSVSVAGVTTGTAPGLIGYVPQRHEFAWDFPISVADAILTGRTRRIGWLRRPKAEDHEAVAAAIDRVRLGELAKRPIGELSGGQRQRVLVARALANEPKILLLDEPFTGVDLPTQEMLNEVTTVLRSEGCAIVTTTHDLGTAARLCDRIVLLNRTVIATGTPDELSDPAIWLRAFGVDSSLDLIRAITKG